MKKCWLNTSFFLWFSNRLCQQYKQKRTAELHSTASLLREESIFIIKKILRILGTF